MFVSRRANGIEWLNTVHHSLSKFRLKLTVQKAAYNKLMRLVLPLIFALTLQACASTGALSVAREQFKNGSAQVALQTLSEADVSTRDRLLLYLDKALVSQAAEQYADSISAFESALELIDELDYFSTRDQTTALISGDWAIRYSGESSERLWIHTFQMINYLMLDQPQGAAVEARRAVAFIDEHENVLNQDLFTRSLMALSFEAAGQRNSAKVEYRKLSDDYNLPAPSPLNSGEQELILLVATGFIEPKLPGDILLDIDLRMSFPYYPEMYSSLPEIEIKGNSEDLSYKRFDTTLLSVARSALEQRGKSIAARQAVRLAAKYNLADNISDKDSLAGGIAKVLLFALEQADTRSWETLPAYLSMLRVTVPANETEITVKIDNLADFSGSLHQIKLPLGPSESKRNFHMIRVGVNNS